MTNEVTNQAMDKEKLQDAFDIVIMQIDQVMRDEQYRVRAVYYGNLIDALIALEHKLHICGCPDEVYEKRGEA
jgi:hypothetical protein